MSFGTKLRFRVKFEWADECLDYAGTWHGVEMRNSLNFRTACVLFQG